MATKKKRKRISRSESDHEKKPAPYIGKGVDLDRLRKAKKEEKEKKKNADRREAERRRTRRGKGVDWTKVDKVGEPVVSFEPASPERSRILKTLSLKKRDPKRVALVKKLAREFIRIYSRYRGEAERNLKGVSDYRTSENELRFAEEAAILCVQKGVTPSNLIRYWDEHVGDFTAMRIPSLSFLSRVANVDTAACASLDDPKPKKPAAGSSFSAIRGLDVRLRPMLERAGYDTRIYNDRFLLGVQSNAIAIAEGRDIFIAKGRLRDMSIAAAELFEKGFLE